MEIQYANNTNPTYENFEAECPYCGAMEVFNRATDFGTFQPIAFRTVKCSQISCGQEFNINNDCINPAHQMLLFDCYEHMARKRFMQCVLSIAQAYESFFAHFFRVQLIYRVYSRDDLRDFRQMSRLENRLFAETKTLGFDDLRRLFLNLVIDAVTPSTLDEAETIISSLQILAKGGVKRKKIEAFSNQAVLSNLVKLHATKVNALRNRIIHKEAYRPTLAETNHVHEESNKVLHGLTGYLRLAGGKSFYISGYLTGSDH